MENSDRPDYFEKIKTFLNSIGIEISIKPIPEKTHLKGVFIEKGTLAVENTLCQTLGSALHEAGHIAIVPFRFRSIITGNVSSKKVIKHYSEYIETHGFMNENMEEDRIVRALMQNDDCSASAWSYAACVACDVPTMLPFMDPSSYDGDGEGIHNMIKHGSYLGINSLRSSGMTETKNLAEFKKVKPFPHMKIWVQP